MVNEFKKNCEKAERAIMDAVRNTLNPNVEEWLVEQGYRVDDDETAFSEVVRYICENRN